MASTLYKIIKEEKSLINSVFYDISTRDYDLVLDSKKDLILVYYMTYKSFDLIPIKSHYNDLLISPFLELF